MEEKWCERDSNDGSPPCLARSLTTLSQSFCLLPVSCLSAGELQKVPRPVEAARGEDVRAGPGEGRDPHEGALVSGRTESACSCVQVSEVKC